MRSHGFKKTGHMPKKSFRTSIGKSKSARLFWGHRVFEGGDVLGYVERHIVVFVAGGCGRTRELLLLLLLLELLDSLPGLVDDLLARVNGLCAGVDGSFGELGGCSNRSGAKDGECALLVEASERVADAVHWVWFLVVQLKSSPIALVVPWIRS